VTSPRPAAPVTTAAVRDAKARAALGRYRVMAWITGVMLLVLVVEMLLKYVLGAPDALLRWIEWVPFAHGWIYVVYLVTVLDLWSKMRWRFGRLVGMVLAGVVPVMSFVVERRVHADAEARLR
jgi:integral membrane protein